MNPAYFLDKLYALLAASDAFAGYNDLQVVKGPAQNVAALRTLEIYPLKLRERTRSANTVACSDLWRISGTLKAAGGNAFEGAPGAPGLAVFMQDVKNALDQYEEPDGDFTSMIFPDADILYQTYPDIVFHMQVEINYLRRIK